MSEFKAQILGILVVLGVFSALAAGYKSIVQSSISQVATEVSSVVANG